MRYRQSHASPFAYLLVIFAFAGAVLLLFALLSLLMPGPEPAAPPPAAVAVSPASPSATLPPTAEPSASPIPPTPRPPTAAASPTLHYLVPANPTPKPTPELPAAAPFPSSCGGPGRMNILLIGVDGRSTNYARASRADAIKVVGVNSSDRTALVLSIPRDLWVQIPADPANPEAMIENRINTAFAWGQSGGFEGAGPGLLAQTIAHNLGLRLDRFVALNFYAFGQAVDAIGGVDIDVPKPLRDEAYPAPGGGTMVVEFPAGLVHMDGPTALIYARTRHPDSDFGRMYRQQQLMFAIREKVLSPEVLPALPNLTALLLSSVHTNLSLEDIGLLGCIGPQIERGAIRTVVIDGSMTTSTVTSEGAYVLLPKMDAILPLLAEFNAGE